MARHHTSLILFLILPIWMGCSEAASPQQETNVLVSDSIMAELFIEFHLLEARANLLNEDIIYLRDSLFDHYNVDTVSYERTMQYYADNPELYMEVYSSALDKLSDERYRPGQ